MKRATTLFTFFLAFIWSGSNNLMAQIQLYGTTTFGGSQGAIFHYTPSTGTYTQDKPFSLYPLGGYPDYENGLTDGGDGYFYGMVAIGGGNGYGLIFKWNPGTNIYAVKYSFNGTNGSTPHGSLTLKDGKFYGMTNSGGASDFGVIFEWDPVTNIYSDKYEFNSNDGANPYGSLTLKDGKFYGMTKNGGANGYGVIFE